MVDNVESALKFYFGMVIFDFHKNLEIHLLPCRPQPLTRREVTVDFNISLSKPGCSMLYGINCKKYKNLYIK